MQESIIVKTCFDVKTHYVITSYKDKLSMFKTSASIIVKLLDQMMIWFDKKIKTTKLASIKDMQKLFKRDDMAQVIGDVIYGSQVHSINEYKLTKIAQYEFIVKQFHEESILQWQHAGLTERLFADYDHAHLVAIMRGAFKTTMSRTIAEMDKRGVWLEYDVMLKEFYFEYKQFV